jgi:hypothetical protein
MSAKLQIVKLFGGVMLIAFLAGCSAATPTAMPTAVPTIDPKPTFDAISTRAVETAIAGMTQNAPTATSVPPTDTPPPTPTVGPSNTPAPTATSTQVFIPWTKTPTATQPVYSCTVTNVSPKSSDTVKVDADFDGSWTLKNTGTSAWSAGNIDIRYVDGTKFQTSGDLYDLSSDVAPNGTYTVTVDMKAPSGDGTYTAKWGLYMDGGYLCQFTMNINVSK